MTASGRPALQIEGSVATITLRRPGEHNHIDPDDPQVVLRHLEEIDKSAEVWSSPCHHRRRREDLLLRLHADADQFPAGPGFNMLDHLEQSKVPRIPAR